MLQEPEEISKFPALHSDKSADVLLQIANQLSDQRYWEVLRYVWIRHGGSISRSRLQKELVLAERPGRKFLMSDQERNSLTNLPNKPTIFHGTTATATEYGWSWSTKFYNSYNFAQIHFNDGPMIVRAKCNKKDIIAYFSDYDENEIVIDPNLVFAHEQFVKDDLYDAKEYYQQRE